VQKGRIGVEKGRVADEGRGVVEKERVGVQKGRKYRMWEGE
jgi:hypothetical protein